MHRFTSVKQYIIVSLCSILLIGCAATRSVQPVNPTHNFSELKADCTIEIRRLRFEGSLARRNQNLYKPFMGAFTQIGEEINCVQNAEYPDAVLDVVIQTSHKSTSGTKFKYVPWLGGVAYAYTGGNLAFDWTGKAEYQLYDTQGNLILRDSIELKGQDTMKAQGGIWGLTGSAIAGASVMAAMYPDENAYTSLGDEFLRTIAIEIAKKVRTSPTSDYFVQQTKDREGMDPRTYAAFISKKQRLQKEREAYNDKLLENLSASILNKDQAIDISNGNIMVFGIGVDNYEHFPDLKYAAKDCLRFTQLIKSRYQLSDEWVMTLINDNATAIKTLRFIERNAAKMLHENDTFIFYFSGHGAPEPDLASGETDGLKKYLLLSDSEPGALSLTAISLNDLAELIKKLPCKKVLVFIDSCFSGMAGRDTLSKLKGIRISSMTYKNMASISGHGRVILAASAENQVSLESNELQAGVFTHWILDKLGAKNAEGTYSPLSILDLYNYVREKVVKDTKSSQTPVFRGVLDENIMM